MKPGNRRTLKESDVIIPLKQAEEGLFFFNARGMLDSRQQKEGNVGFGMRWLFQGSLIIGGYAHGDIRRTQLGTKHYQLASGVEVLSQWLDLRGNFYLPKHKRRAFYTDGYVQVTNRLLYEYRNYLVEQTMRGGDLEVGGRLPIGVGLPLPIPFIEEVRLYVARYHSMPAVAQVFRAPGCAWK